MYYYSLPVKVFNRYITLCSILFDNLYLVKSVKFVCFLFVCYRLSKIGK